MHNNLNVRFEILDVSTQKSQRENKKQHDKNIFNILMKKGYNMYMTVDKLMLSQSGRNNIVGKTLLPNPVLPAFKNYNHL